MLPETGGPDKPRLMSQAPYMTTHGSSGKWNRGSVKQIRGDRVRPPAGRCEVEESHPGYEHDHQVVDLVDLRDAPDERPEPDLQRRHRIDGEERRLSGPAARLAGSIGGETMGGGA